MKNKIIYAIVILVVVLLAIFVTYNQKSEDSSVYKVGYIGPMTGPAAKYGSYESVKLATDEINSKGGINGKKLEIIFEDGKCSGKDAVSAAKKLIEVDKVKIVLGGHCSPESVAIYPLLESNKVLMLASITSSPALSNVGKYIFRTSPVSTVQSVVIADYLKKTNLKKIAIVYEQTDYARPIAENLKNNLVGSSVDNVLYEGFTPGTTDFRTIVAKIKASGADSVFVSPQSPDAGLNILQQVREINSSVVVLGNDAMANQVIMDKPFSNGLLISQPPFDAKDDMFVEFSNKYKATFSVGVPYGIWTAESYDATILIAKAIESVGYDSDKIVKYLEGLNNYKGASGVFSINKQHDGVRDYFMKVVKNGGLVDL